MSDEFLAVAALIVIAFVIGIFLGVDWGTKNLVRECQTPPRLTKIDSKFYVCNFEPMN